jgi:hypothetical protein
MQLAILLTLVNKRGEALPNQRTALYDAYIDVFLDRESEKSTIVRDHRNLLIDIHGYIAWKLHSEAEENGGRGSIGAEELRAVLRKYVMTDGHDPLIVESLFTGMVERVVALSSRVQGEYEFIVQPLREYFCARYLYNGAPPSPQGSESGGTHIDIFEALVPHPHWLNVLRFFAGRASKGELDGLVASLETLARNATGSGAVHIREVALLLAGDFVFSQQPRTVNRLLQSVLDDLGIRTAGAAFSTSPRTTGLSERAGRQEIRQIVEAALERELPVSVERELIWTLRTHMTEGQFSDWWQRRAGERGTMAALRALRPVGKSVSSAQIRSLVETTADKSDAVRLVLACGRADAIEESDDLLRLALSTVATSSEWLTGFESFVDYGLLAHLSQLTMISGFLRENHGYVPFSGEQWAAQSAAATERAHSLNDEGLSKLILRWGELIAHSTDRLGSDRTRRRAMDYSRWAEIVGLCQQRFGIAPITLLLLDAVGGAPRAPKRSNRGGQLAPLTAGLLDDVFAAQAATDDSDWWMQRVSRPSDDERVFAAWLVMRFASSSVIASNAAQIAELVGELSTAAYRKTCLASFDRTLLLYRRPAADQLTVFPGLQPRIAGLFWQRLSPQLVRRLAIETLGNAEWRDPVLASLGRDLALLVPKGTGWQSALELDQIAADISPLDLSATLESHNVRTLKRVPEDALRAILSSPFRHTASLMSLAHSVSSQQQAPKRMTIAAKAAKDHWFVGTMT